MLKYEGVFFEEDVVDLIHSLEVKPLPIAINEIHCTFKYLPKDNEIFNNLIGKNFEVTLIGYGNDGMNSGFEVALPTELVPYYINYDEQNPKVLKVPHITASLAEGAEACNTKNLKFKALKKPIKIIGKFGYFIEEENDNYLSYDPFYEKIISNNKS